MLPHFVIDYLKHRAVEIGVEAVSYMEPQGFVAVDGNCRREELIRVPGAFCKEVRYLAALHINDCDGFPFCHLYGCSTAGGDEIFPHRLRSFRMM